MCRRFVEGTCEEAIETFSKIKQRGFVVDYQELFEDLKSQVMLSLPHLLELYYISIFTSELKEEIKSMVKIIKPTSIPKPLK